MPNFSDIDSLMRWVKESGWIEAKTSSGLTMKDILQQEAEKLKRCLERSIDEYYDSYQPSDIVPRTYGLQNSLFVDKLVGVDISNGKLSIAVKFDEDLIQAESIFGSDSSNYNVASLINDGWEVKKDVSFKGIEHFGWRSGDDFVKRALQYFYADNPYNLKVHVEGFKNTYE